MGAGAALTPKGEAGDLSSTAPYTAAVPWDVLTDEQRELRDHVRTLARERIAPRAAEIDRTDEFPRDLYRRMAALDLLGMTVPPAYGGAGADTVSWCVAQEELARASAAVADAQLLCKLMCDMILANGTEAQRQRHLPAMVRGEEICAIAQTEPGTGSDVAGVRRPRPPPATAGS